MKVILIKDCKDGKINTVIDVSDGYGVNFLIKQGYALPYNVKTSKVMSDKVAEEERRQKEIFDNAMKVKEAIEADVLHFSLKTTNNVVHGSITRKQINEALIEKGIRVPSHDIENVKIQSIGVSKVKITLHKKVMAILRVEVKDEK